MRGNGLRLCQGRHGQFSHLSLLAGQYSIIPPDSPVLGVVGDGAVLPCQLQGRIIPEKLSIQNLRIPGWVGWEGPLAHPVPSPSMGRGTSRYSRMFQALSKLALDTSRDGAATASLGIPFQPLSALPVKNFFPISRLLREFLVCPLLELDFSRCAAQGAEPSVFLDGHAGNGISLSCRSQGWFPAPSVVWLDSQGQTRPEEVTTRSTPGPSSGIFDVVSSMSLELGSDREVSCRVVNEVLNATRESRVRIAGDPWIIRTMLPGTGWGDFGAVQGQEVTESRDYQHWERPPRTSGPTIGWCSPELRVPCPVIPWTLPGMATLSFPGQPQWELMIPGGPPRDIPFRIIHDSHNVLMGNEEYPFPSLLSHLGADSQSGKF
uniref:Uncharacterized protein n=1 Tax=Corvus moneduloides TaxID=1196302 RepID=A0A8U7P9W3_CORMO